jgi:sarcosine oxidase/L-pipecolate oxidase
MNNGNVNVVILLDLKKAFDVVDHDITAKKLEIYGFNKKALALFNYYMTNRTQQVQIGNALSNKCPLKYGVPQGSILGSLLFILYMNDLPLSISNCNTDMYADDSTIHISEKNISAIQTKVQEDLNRIELWCKDNCSKTKCMTVGTKQKLAFQNEELSWGY